LFDLPGTPAAQARLLRPVASEQIGALGVISEQICRMAQVDYNWTRAWNETEAREAGYIEWNNGHVPAWDEVILQGPHFSVATPFAKEPNENCKSMKDYADWDLEELSEQVIPRTNYRRATNRDRYNGGLALWNGRPYTEYFRLGWRN